jgi:hypothetical protein
VDFLFVFLFVLALELVFLLVQREGDPGADDRGLFARTTSTSSVTTSTPTST